MAVRLRAGRRKSRAEPDLASPPRSSFFLTAERRRPSRWFGASLGAQHREIHMTGETNLNQPQDAHLGDHHADHCARDPDRVHDLGRHSAVRMAEVLWSRFSVRARSGAGVLRRRRQLRYSTRHELYGRRDRRQQSEDRMAALARPLHRRVVVGVSAEVDAQEVQAAPADRRRAKREIRIRYAARSRHHFCGSTTRLGSLCPVISDR